MLFIIHNLLFFSRVELPVLISLTLPRIEFSFNHINSHHLFFNIMTSISRKFRDFCLENVVKGLLTVTSVTMILLALLVIFKICIVKN